MSNSIQVPQLLNVTLGSPSSYASSAPSLYATLAVPSASSPSRPQEEKKDEDLKEEVRKKLVIIHSKDVPEDARKVFASLGACVDFDHRVHSSIPLNKIVFDYLYVDVTNKENRLYLKLHRAELDEMDSLAYGYSWEFESLEREDAWFNCAKKYISAFDMLIGDYDMMRNALFNDKIKYQSKPLSLLKKLFSCLSSQ